MPPAILNTPPPKMERLLNWKQVADLVGCSRSQFYRMVHEGKFEVAYRIHDHKGVMVPEWAVSKYLDAREMV